MEPADWLRSVAKPGAPPWNIGSLAIAADVYRIVGGFYREEIGLTVEPGDGDTGTPPTDRSPTSPSRSFTSRSGVTP